MAADVRPVVAAEGETEFYSARPGIETVEISNEDLGKKSTKLLTGIVDFIAEMRAFYPDSVFYILARDGEAIYDLWKLLFPQDFAKGRVKLINVSTPSKEDPNLKSYLKSVGLIEDIEMGRHVVALDSGYEGRIVDAINEILRKKGKLYAHLMSSAHTEIPSSRISTRTFLASALRKKDVEDEDYVSEAADMAVVALEDIQHFTETATSYERLANGKWDAASIEISRQLKRKALAFMGGLKRLAMSAETQAQAKRSYALIERAMKMLRGDDLVTPQEVKALTADLQAAGIEGVWADLRESVGKGTIAIYNPLRYQEIFAAVPEDLKSLDDVWEEDGLGEIREREAEIAKLAAKQAVAKPAVKPAQPRDQAAQQIKAGDDFWVADIIRLYLRGLEEEGERQEIFDAFKAGKKAFRHPSSGGDGAIGKKIGEGVRSDVYVLGARDIIKTAYDAEDMTALEGEKLVFDFLKRNAAKYPFRLLEITEMGPKGIYLIKPRIEKDTIGKYILRNNGALTREQLRSLEAVYNVSRQLAEDPGISLDIKADNLVWTNKGWMILDLGARTMSHPYFFTLECPSFARYLEIWNSDSDSRSGVMDVEDYIMNSRRACEAAVIHGYRELKADD
jgi:hypothetical protein